MLHHALVMAKNDNDIPRLRDKIAVSVIFAVVAPFLLPFFYFLGTTK
jgi:hypothetical protein